MTALQFIGEGLPIPHNWLYSLIYTAYSPTIMKGLLLGILQIYPILYHPRYPRTCGYQKNIWETATKNRIRRGPRDPLIQLTHTMVNMENWQSENMPKLALLAPSSVTFLSSFTVGWLWKAGRTIKKQDKGRGDAPQESVAPLQSLQLKGTIYFAFLTPLCDNSHISLFTVGKLESSEVERLAP